MHRDFSIISYSNLLSNKMMFFITIYSYVKCCEKCARVPVTLVITAINSWTIETTVTMETIIIKQGCGIE